MENGSYGMTICAVRFAIVAAAEVYHLRLHAVLVTGPAATGKRVFERLMRAARSGGLRGSQLTASYDRIRALKRRLPG